MIYPYRCSSCDHEFEVIKAVADIDRVELCPKCFGEGVRYISTTHFYGASDWHGATYNPGLGCVVESKKHQRQIMRDRGLEEIGTTPPEFLEKMERSATAEKKKKQEDDFVERAKAWMNR